MHFYCKHILFPDLNNKLIGAESADMTYLLTVLQQGYSLETGLECSVITLEIRSDALITNMSGYVAYIFCFGSLYPNGTDKLTFKPLNLKPLSSK